MVVVTELAGVTVWCKSLEERLGPQGRMRGGVVAPWIPTLCGSGLRCGLVKASGVAHKQAGEQHVRIFRVALIPWNTNRIILCIRDSSISPRSIYLLQGLHRYNDYPSRYTIILESSIT